MQLLAIPDIENDELRNAVSALTRAACVMRTLFLMVAEGKPVKYRCNAKIPEFIAAVLLNTQNNPRLLTYASQSIGVE